MARSPTLPASARSIQDFKVTCESILPSLERDRQLIGSADVVHFVGHSLGGAVATLLAAKYAGAAKSVKLYTFGSPRVGAFTTYEALETRIGPQNIFRVAHDLDVISLIGPFPYIHVNPSPRGPGFMTLPSRFNLGLGNHDMMAYIDSIALKDWAALERESNKVDHEASVLARVLLHGESKPAWVRYACAKTLTLLFRLFSHALRTISTSLILGLTAVDLLAELLYRGVHKLNALGAQIYQLMGYAADWAGIKLAQGAQFTAAIIKLILDKMLATLKAIAVATVTRGPIGLSPMGLAIPAWVLMSSNVF
jgi:triacylglycerol lipase